MFGVSPAFILSLYGRGFSTRDFLDALPRVKALGFSAYQPEIFLGSELPAWERDARTVDQAAFDLGLVPTQFIAHFMLEQFSNPEQLTPRKGLEELKRVIAIARAFPPCSVLTIPAGPFQVDWDAPWASGGHGWQAARRKLVDKIGLYVEKVAEAGLKLAFEILPYSVIGGIGRFLALCSEIGSPALGLNFDTGHAWACRELLPMLPFELRGRIFGTHLGDNLSTENIKLAPGKGTIPWKPLLENLLLAGYGGSWDIEIGCDPDQVAEEYRYGLAYLKTLEIHR